MTCNTENEQFHVLHKLLTLTHMEKVLNASLCSRVERSFLVPPVPLQTSNMCFLSKSLGRNTHRYTFGKAKQQRRWDNGGVDQKGRAKIRMKGEMEVWK